MLRGLLLLLLLPGSLFCSLPQKASGGPTVVHCWRSHVQQVQVCLAAVDARRLACLLL
jgi:hypothetical protein